MRDTLFETNLGLLLVNIAHYSYTNERYGFDLYKNALIQSCFANKTKFCKRFKKPLYSNSIP